MTRKTWSWRLDLNQRPTDYKSVALPAELRQQLQFLLIASNGLTYASFAQALF